MNWKEIREKCPKAVNKLYEYHDIEDEHKTDFIHVFFIGRGLYDFFDEQELFIEIELMFNEHRRFTGKFGYVIVSYDWSEYGDVNIATRKEAEETAFTKAFEILESKK